MANPIELKKSKRYAKSMVLLWGLCGGMAALFFMMGVPALGSKYGAGQGMMLLFLGLISVAIPGGLILNSRRGVKRFDQEGATAFTGRKYAWTDFETVTPVEHRGRFGVIITHYRLKFRTGTTSVNVRIAENAAEIVELMRGLARGENPYLTR